MSRMQFMRNEYKTGYVTLLELGADMQLEQSSNRISVYKAGSPELLMPVIHCTTTEAANEFLKLYAKFRQSERVIFDVNETLAAINQEMPV